MNGPTLARQWRPGYFMAGGAQTRTAPPPKPGGGSRISEKGALLMIAVRLRPIQRAGGEGGGGVLSAFGRFNEPGGEVNRVEVSPTFLSRTF